MERREEEGSDEPKDVEVYKRSYELYGAMGVMPT